MTWNYYKNTLAGETLIGPVTQLDFVDAIRGGVVTAKTKVQPTGQAWMIAGQIPMVTGIISKMKLATEQNRIKSNQEKLNAKRVRKQKVTVQVERTKSKKRVTTVALITSLGWSNLGTLVGRIAFSVGFVGIIGSILWILVTTSVGVIMGLYPVNVGTPVTPIASGLVEFRASIIPVGITFVLSLGMATMGAIVIGLGDISKKLSANAQSKLA